MFSPNRLSFSPNKLSLVNCQTFLCSSFECLPGNSGFVPWTESIAFSANLVPPPVHPGSVWHKPLVQKPFRLLTPWLFSLQWPSNFTHVIQILPWKIAQILSLSWNDPLCEIKPRNQNSVHTSGSLRSYSPECSRAPGRAPVSSYSLLPAATAHWMNLKKNQILGLHTKIIVTLDQPMQLASP